MPTLRGHPTHWDRMEVVGNVVFSQQARPRSLMESGRGKRFRFEKALPAETPPLAMARNKIFELHFLTGSVVSEASIFFSQQVSYIYWYEPETIRGGLGSRSMNARSSIFLILMRVKMKQVSDQTISSGDQRKVRGVKYML